MTNEEIKHIWSEWEIDEKPIGKGSFGEVYKAVRGDCNVKSEAAIKVISIPSDPAEVDSLRSEGMDINATKTVLQGIVDAFVKEIQLMETLKGIPNIVSVEDYKVVEKTDEIGWIILIRMELLTPINKYTCDKTLDEKEVIKLGCDICTALEVCGKLNIIHRDIKPENIFIHKFGDFKLGDFGIARKPESMTGGLSRKGTPNYMAPEVANGNNYDSRADTYSLGIVLYRLLNGNRLPFLDPEKQILSYNERETALDRRLHGEPLPAPKNASPEMADVILRACAYDPKQRFSSATEMKQALTSVANGTYQIVGVPTPNTAPVFNAASAPDPGDPVSDIAGSVDRLTANFARLVASGEPRNAPSDIGTDNAPAHSADEAVGVFGVSDDELKRKKRKKLIIILSSAGAACLALVLALVIIPKVIGAPRLGTAEGERSGVAEESVIPVVSSAASSSLSAEEPTSSAPESSSSSSSSSKSSSSSSSSSKSSSSSSSSSKSSSSSSSSSKSSSSSSSSSKSSSSSSSSSKSSSSSSSSSKSSSSSSSKKPVSSSTTSSAPHPAEISVSLNANGGNVSTNTLTAVSGEAFGELPAPQRDYYTFEGWYTSSDGGSRIDSTSKVDKSSKTLYAHWKQNPVSDWVLESQAPSSAEITDSKWTYTQTQSKESKSASEPGWTQVDSYWNFVKEELYAYIDFPANSDGRVYYNTSDRYYTNFTDQPLVSYETENTKRTIVENGVTSYIYYHWCYELDGYHTEGERPIGYYYGEQTGYGPATVWESIEAGDVSYDYNKQAYRITGHSTYSYYWNGKLPVHRQTYTDYEKIYKLEKTTTLESATEVTAGGDISNVEKYVKYREK